MIILDDSNFLNDILAEKVPQSLKNSMTVSRAVARAGSKKNMSAMQLDGIIKNYFTNRHFDTKHFDIYYNKYCDDVPVLKRPIPFYETEMIHCAHIGKLQREGKWTIEKNRRVFLTLLFLFKQLSTNRLRVSFREVCKMAGIPSTYRKRYSLNCAVMGQCVGVTRKNTGNTMPAFFFKEKMMNDIAGDKVFEFCYVGDSFCAAGVEFKSNISEIYDRFIEWQKKTEQLKT